MWQNVLPVITLIVGGLLTYLTQSGTDARQRRTAREALLLDRAARREERRETFELGHLLRLNEALMRYARAVGKAHHHDAMVAKQSGAFASHQLPEDLSDEEHLAGREVLGLMNLVLDDDLRAKVNREYQLMSHVASLTDVTVEEARAALGSALRAHEVAMEGIAARIRQIYIDQAVSTADRPR